MTAKVNQAWLDQFARSIAQWFNDRGEKWNQIFNEAFIAIPTAEFLLKEGWRLSSEMSNQVIANDKGIPYVAYDIFASKNGESSLLIEMKLLRPVKRKGVYIVGGPQNKGRVRGDIVRLRNAKDPCHRILVVVVHSSVKNSAVLMSSLVETNVGELSANDVAGETKVWAFYLNRLPNAAVSTR